jgi:hypothetical protein
MKLTATPLCLIEALRSEIFFRRAEHIVALADEFLSSSEFVIQ